MIEVFVAFVDDSTIEDLEKTLEAWELPGLEPVAIRVQPKKFELFRRVTAENVSRGTFILADLGYGPVEEDFGKLAESAMKENPGAGMILPNGLEMAVVCRKGLVQHWPAPRTGSYNAEHIQAYELVGYKTISCPTLHCIPLAAFLVS